MTDLRALLVGLPPGTLIPASWVLEQLEESPGAALTPTGDLTVDQLSSHFGMAQSTVRTWLERGDFPGAYKLSGRAWRIPAAALVTFQAGQQDAGPMPEPSTAPTPRRRSRSNLGAWRDTA